MDKTVRLFSPATVANVACGFDIFGFAVETPGDELILTLKEGGGARVQTITGDQGRLPLSAEKNVAAYVANLLLKQLKREDLGVEIVIHKQMPLGSGLGSSAASAAGSLFGLNKLLGNPLTREELVPLAMEGERLASGSAHADNVAPALLGGFTLIRSYAPLDIVKVPCNLPLYCVLLHPHVEVLTRSSRALLPQEIPLKKHIAQSGNAAALIAAIIQGDSALLSRSLEDVIAEPARSGLVPGFQRCKKAALDAGALGCSLSGSGPSLFALALAEDEAAKVAEAMGRAMDEEGLSYTLYTSPINETGPKLL